MAGRPFDGMTYSTAGASTASVTLESLRKGMEEFEKRMAKYPPRIFAYKGTVAELMEKAGIPKLDMGFTLPRIGSLFCADTKHGIALVGDDRLVWSLLKDKGFGGWIVLRTAAIKLKDGELAELNWDPDNPPVPEVPFPKPIPMLGVLL